MRKRSLGVVIGGLLGVLALGCGPSNERPRAVPPREVLAPGAAEALLASADPLGIEPLSGGRAVLRTKKGRAKNDFAVELGARSDDPMTVSAGGTRIEVRRLGVESRLARREGSFVRFGTNMDEESADWFVVKSAVEELVTLRKPGRLAYDFELPERWSLRSHAPWASVVEVLDETRRARLRVRADAAWDKDARSIPVALRVEGNRLSLEVDASSNFPVVIDPTWESSGEPLFRRLDGIATLLPSGRLLINGGWFPHAIATLLPELYDPSHGSFTVVGPSPLNFYNEVCGAVLARSGKVMMVCANGRRGTFDEVTGEFEVLTEGETMGGLPIGPVLLDDDRILFGIGSKLHFYDSSSGAEVSEPLPFLEQRLSAGAAKLSDGRVLLVGDSKGAAAHAEIYDPSSHELALTKPVTLPGSVRALRLVDGRVLVGDGFDYKLFQPQTSDFADLGPTTLGNTGTNLLQDPSGRVLLFGSAGVEAFDAVTSTFVPFAADGMLPVETMLTLPSASMFGVAGLSSGVLSFTASARNLGPSPVKQPHLAPLPSGKVLVVGSGSGKAFEFDPATETYDPLPGPRATKRRPMFAPMRSGRVFYAFGVKDTRAAAQVFDPETKTWGPEVPITKQTYGSYPPIERAKAVALRDGRVLIVGGEGSAGAVDGAAIYDDVAKAFVSVPSMTVTRLDPVAVLLADGKVLVAGGNTRIAELFEPELGKFRPVKGTMLTAQGGLFGVRLTNGEVLLVSEEADAEIYSPESELFRPIRGVNPRGALVFSLTLLPSGRVLLTDVDDRTFTFDPATESFTQQKPNLCPAPPFDDPSNPLVLPTGAVFALGCGSERLGRTWRETDPVAMAIPVLTKAPVAVAGGAVVDVGGSRLRGAFSNATGVLTSTATDYPIGVWLSQDGSERVVGRLTGFDDTSAKWNVPAGPSRGRGVLFPITNGVTGHGVITDLDAGALGAACSQAVECQSGVCVDSVCCESECNGACRACSAKRKGQGKDGVCEAVVQGVDPDGDCLKQDSDSCGQMGVCDGEGRCALYPDGSACQGDGFCQTGICVATRPTCASNLDCPTDQICDVDRHCAAPRTLPGSALPASCSASASAEPTELLWLSALGVLFAARRRCARRRLRQGAR